MAFKRHGHLTVASGSAVLLAALGVLAFSALSPAAEGPQQPEQGDERPSLSLRASPSVAFSSGAILFVAALRGRRGRLRRVLLPEHRVGLG